jgi:hypothetical protein
MHRFARWSPAFSALFALWFAIVLGDPGMLHACPMHGGHGAQGAQQAAAPAPGHDMAGMHGHHMAPPTTQGSHQGSQHQAPAPGPCTCVGHCCAAPVPAPLPIVATLPIPAVVAEARHPLAAPSSPAPAAPDVRLPFANGPPAL